MFGPREESRHHGAPIRLYLFRGAGSSPTALADFDAGPFGPYGYCDGEVPLTRDGITYVPWPVTMDDITSAGNLDKSDITVTLARGTDLETEFIGYPASQLVNLTIFVGHEGDPMTLANWPAAWVGRVGAPVFERDTVAFNCVPVSSLLQRPGLRRNYQLGCPHVLYGAQCRAERKINSRAVTLIQGSSFDFATPLPNPHLKYRGGLVQWRAGERWAIRTIIGTNPEATRVTVRGTLGGLAVGDFAQISLGCNHLQSDCLNLHDNIHNFGGQPHIPLQNPLSQKNLFY